MSVSNYNAFSIHKTLFLKDDEYYVVAGYQNILPSTELIHDYPFGELQYAGIEKRNILMSGVQRVYYIVPDAVYETIDYPIFKVFSYEVEHWTEKTN